jgi:hypothetical protein
MLLEGAGEATGGASAGFLGVEEKDIAAESCYALKAIKHLSGLVGTRSIAHAP